MDLEDIGNKISNLTFYDIKSFYTQAKNYALNISDIEAKVREATNDDPWGASSTLMQEIAQAHDFNEIMPTIFRRFMEKEARDWRQIYKALQLLEYIVKHGSERVVDEARSHLSTIKILRNFHYIDEKGKDQGINGTYLPSDPVRNRAKELATLLSDVELIRSERRKARANRTKYQGTGNSDFVPGSGGGRYGGFSSDAYHAGGAASYRGSSSYAEDAHQAEYDEYDAGEDERESRTSSSTTTRKTPATKSQPVVEDLFDFNDEETAVNTQPNQSSAAAAEDFDDFQSAPTTTSNFAPDVTHTKQTTSTSASQTKPAGVNLFDFLDNAPSKPVSTQSSSATFSPNLSGNSAKPSSINKSSIVVPTASTKPSTASTFDDLWATSRGRAEGPDEKGKKSMAQLAKDQTSSSVWGGSNSAAKSSGQSKDLFDLL
ncbi:Epsin-3, clathrin recruitment and traffic between the Golgi and endosome [Malassezia psittaci]|uniref:Epsin-3, clathrin recruitment and traffic between the Golgi and endosome n=1 Tax=Malassezia psittaci TaxID=1821823 RepID=A0AAF0F9D1_9BASI|nr:Epsin-3, clathrin recruitment and traffic between the Golgi and endosome [Malassezia psittaci]